MDKHQAKELIAKYNAGNCTEEESALVENWYTDLKYIADAPDPEEILIAHDAVWAALQRKRKTFRLYYQIGAAAAAVAAIVFGIWFYTLRPVVNGDSKIVNQNSIMPGRNTATLTLANGRVINLSDAKTGVVIGADKLAYNDGTDLGGHDPELSAGSGTGKHKIIMLTATTPRGGAYQVTLPDGTRVWLNAASKILFPSQFSGTDRKIQLNGEAYFEVKKAKQPFIVESDGQQVEVLGTHFNINAYNDEGNVKTTLLEGSVRVTYAQQHGAILKPNQQATVAAGKNIIIKTIDPKETIAWKDGYFRFNDEKIESIMRKVSRWYDVDVEYKGEITKEGFNGAITRYSSIGDVLEIMEGSKAVHFKIEGRRIIVTK